MRLGPHDRIDTDGRIGQHTTARLWAAAVLCVVPFGLVWSQSSGTVGPGTVTPGYCSPVPGGYCNPVGIYLPGVYTPGNDVLVRESPARVFLVIAALLLVTVAVQARTAGTRRLARAASVSIAIGAVLALSHRASTVLVCLLLAEILVMPPAWNGAAFGSARARR